MNARKFSFLLINSLFMKLNNYFFSSTTHFFILILAVKVPYQVLGKYIVNNSTRYFHLAINKQDSSQLFLENVVNLTIFNVSNHCFLFG